ncbi:MAG: flagellar motor switch protein FliN [Kineosporiaceae bacterium]
MNPAEAGVDAGPLEQARLAADAALPLLPVASGATIEPVAVDEVPADWPAVLQRFTGTPSGWCALVLDPAAVTDLVSALTQAGSGEAEGSDLAAACGPALRAATGALGPVAGVDPEATTASAVPADPDVVAVRIAVDGAAAAYLLLSVTAGTTIPGPRRAPDLTGATGGTGGPGGRPATTAHGLELLRSVPMEVTAEIGRTRMTIQELLALTPGAVVELDRPVGSPADVLVNGRLFARGEVVVVDEDFAIRVTEIVDTSETPGT